MRTQEHCKAPRASRKKWGEWGGKRERVVLRHVPCRAENYTLKCPLSAIMDSLDPLPAIPPLLPVRGGAELRVDGPNCWSFPFVPFSSWGPRSCSGEIMGSSDLSLVKLEYWGPRFKGN